MSINMYNYVDEAGFLRDRGEIEDHYLTVAREWLPRKAEPGTWPIVNDHCFMRVCYDNAFGDEWYDYVDGSPAYEAIEDRMLVKATSLALHMYHYEAPAVRRLNERSLYWRDEIEASELTHNVVGEL